MFAIIINLFYKFKFSNTNKVSIKMKFILN